jgi:ubiquinone/menaquinone biosynthesis C-methylase UbiE
MSARDQKYVKEIIHMTKSEIGLKSNLEKISRLVLTYSNLKKDETRQDFIVSKIMNFIDSYIMNDQSTIVDIGGGNGNVLSGLKLNLGGAKEQYICVETASDWVESYEFNKTSCTYVFWDNNSIDVPTESCDLVLCMVSLHHMSDEIISKTLREIYRILKPSGLVMIKEHDNNSTDANMLIHWEHHLYHILDCAYNKEHIQTDSYLQQTIHNFKSKESWKEIFEYHEFEFHQRTNRFLEETYIEHDIKNPSNLYWDIYTKLHRRI